MVTYTKSQKWKKEGDRLTVEKRIRSTLLSLDLKDDKLRHSGKECITLEITLHSHRCQSIHLDL